jgi:hypothetical protein
MNRCELNIRRTLTLLLVMLLSLAGHDVCAQNARKLRQQHNRELMQRRDSLAVDSLPGRTLLIPSDSLRAARDVAETVDSLRAAQLEAPVDTAALAQGMDSLNAAAAKPAKPRFIPDSRKATWLAMIFPGGGQIYNRKYWKLPIVYGGFVGCAYAISWNGKMYSDYSQAYLDIMDDDPNTKSYEDFISSRVDINSRLEYYQNIFKRRKDTYRRQRDLSIFCMIGVYVLSIIDAYVDAELSDFDISKDLSLRVEPVIWNDRKHQTSHTVGLQCSLKF